MTKFRNTLPARTGILSLLRNKDGIEVSIPNIIVALVVSLVVIASVVAGVVFLIPFAQDSGAKGDVQTVQSAQQVYYAKAAPSRYGTGPELVAAKAILASEKKVAIVASGAEYCAAALSDTGTIFYVTSGSSTITDTVPAGVTCPTPASMTAVGFKGQLTK